VRAAAIAWVMLYHAMTLDLVPDPDHWFIMFGWMGVDLFFVLSGFLIASQLLRPWAEGARPDYKRFFARRLLRTLPAYAAILAVYLLVPAAREWPDMQPAWQFATFTENLLFEPTAPKAFSHIWSLCVEEQFYLVFPAVVALLAWRPSARRTGAILAFVLLFGVAIRSWLWLRYVAQPAFDPSADPDGGAYMAFIYYPTWSRLDGLLAGIAAAALKIYRPAAWARLVARPNLLLACGLAGIGAAILLFHGQIAHLPAATLGFPLLSGAIALVVAAASTDRALLGRFPIPGAAALATAAYSLYLSQKIAYHAVVATLTPRAGLAGYPRLALAVAAALALGALLYWTVERPFLRLRDRLEGPSRSSIARAPSGAPFPHSGRNPESTETARETPAPRILILAVTGTRATARPAPGTGWNSTRHHPPRSRGGGPPERRWRGSGDPHEPRRDHAGPSTIVAPRFHAETPSV
jgi:peptidoglycan/LPS O-acetylase OafA/YrhL